MNGNRYTVREGGMESLTDALKLLPEELHNRIGLANNALGEDTGRALAETLRLNTTLRELELSYNNIGDDGARALAEALRRNTTLTSLRLADNALGEDTGSALTETLRLNTTLRELDIHRNYHDLTGNLRDHDMPLCVAP